MKKHFVLLAFALQVALTSALSIEANAQVRINEFLLHTADRSLNSLYIREPCSDNYRTGEWIELYNTSTTETIDIGCWLVGANQGDEFGPPERLCFDNSDQGQTGTNFGWLRIPQGTLLPPRSFYTIGGRNVNFDPNLRINPPVSCAGFRFHLNGTAGWLGVFRPDGRSEDAVYWTQNDSTQISTSRRFDITDRTSCTCSGQALNLPSAKDLFSAGNIDYVGNSYLGINAPDSTRAFRRVPDGSNCWVLSDNPNPGESNGTCDLPQGVRLFVYQPEKTNYCIGDRVVFTAQDASLRSPCTDTLAYRWTDENGQVLGTEATLELRLQSSTNIQLDVRGPDCQQMANRDFVVLAPANLPNPLFEMLPAPVVCTEENVSVIGFWTNESDTASQYEWLFAGTTPQNATGPGPHQLQWLQNGSFAIQLTWSRENCRQVLVDTSLQVVSAPTDLVRFSKATLCLGDTLLLSLSPESSSRISTVETLNGTAIISDDGLSAAVYGWPSGARALRVGLRASSALRDCEQFTTYTIDVGTPAAVELRALLPESGGCGLPDVVLVGNLPAGAQLRWDFDGADAQPGTRTAGPHTLRWPVAGRHQIGVRVFGGGCAVQSLQTEFDFQPKPAVLPEWRPPDAFSPNADGINDLWYLPDLAPSCGELRLQVYDRWGKQVYSYPDDGLTWDGSLSGKALPEGSYAYRFELTLPGWGTSSGRGGLQLIR